jgi:hypothetical protein
MANKAIATVKFNLETKTKGGVLRFKEVDKDGQFIQDYKETTMGTVYLRLPEGSTEPKSISVTVR